MPILCRFQDVTIYWSNICVFCRFYPLHSRLKPAWVFPWDPGYESWCRKARGPENRMIVRLLVLIQYQRLTDGHAADASMSRPDVAECDKNVA